MPPTVLDSSRLRARRFRTWRSILALILREMSTTYGRSPGGYVWAVLEPVAAIALLSIAFQFVFKQPSLGTNFPFYFATGYLPYMMALNIMNNVARAIRFSKALLAYPGVTWVDAVLARAILSALTDLLTGALVIGGIVVIFDLQFLVRPEAIAMSVGLAVTLGLGVGALNCYLFSSLPLWERFWGVVTRPLMLLSGVIFLYDTVPPVVQTVMWWNPMTHVVGASRLGFFGTYDGSYISVVFVLVVALATGAFGFLLLHRHHKALSAE